MYRLIFSNQTNLLPQSNEDNVQNVRSIRTRTSDVITCIRSGQDLIGYKYLASAGTWQQYWSEKVFSQRGNYPLERYPWLLVNKLLPNADAIILKHPDGIRFYQIDLVKPGLKLLKEDDHFHDVYDYTLLLGNFYPDEGYVGVITLDPRGEAKFFAAMKDSFLSDTKYPLFPLQKELSLTPVWHSRYTDFFIANILHNNQEAIGVLTAKGLEIYRFDADYLLERIVRTTQIAKSEKKELDRIYFADLTHRKYRDILRLNNSGLYVYQYDNGEDYKTLEHNTQFSESYGWLPHYSDSIRITDIDGDKRDDLIFTGPQGITALSFDSATNKWKTLLSSDELSGLQRFATVVGSIPAMSPQIPQPSIFTQDTTGRVQWAKVVQKQLIINKAKPTTSTALTPTLANATTSSFSQIRQDHLFPEQIVRTNLPEKPALRWSEQWSDGFLKEAVDIASGQVHLNVPLMDISSVTGWALQLALSYDNSVIAADVLGTGWSLSLAQDYIFADYQGSVIPENTRYYLMTKGLPHHLKLTTTEKGIQRFQLEDADDTNTSITIEYHPVEQRWIVEEAAEQIIYGKANRVKAKDALLWSLGWPNWRGPGRDKARQQPLITAWYLNTRFDKNKQQELYYYYEIDNSNLEGGKPYSSGIRLKTVSDNQQLQLTFDYSPKARSEYTVPNPIDDQGYIVFPVPLIQTHYLRGYSITTSAYSQEFKFGYKVDKETRLLATVTQQLLSYSDPIMKFSYQRLLEKHILKSCQLLARGTTLNFSYEILSPPSPAPNNKISYPCTKNTKIAYGPDYSVKAHVNSEANKVILRIMNRQMTQIITDSLADTNLLNPSKYVQVKDYSVQAGHSSLVVFIVTDYKGALYMFNRNNKHVWSSKPSLYSFSKQALVRIGETVIAVAEPDKNEIRLLERDDNQSDWNEKTLSVPRAMTFLALYKKLVVGYDGNQLWLFHHNDQSNWQSKVLESNLAGLTSMNRQTLASFDFASTVAQQISTALEQNGLQILNNFILLSALQENNGQLFLHIHLFLLDSQNNVTKRRSFKIKRDNLYQIVREFKSRDGKIIHHWGYVKEGGRYKVRVKYISGKSIEDIRNKNRRQDAIEEQTKQINNDPEFQKSVKEHFLLDWNLYSIHISPFGAYCGNDTLIRITGTDWEQDSLSHKNQTIRLGQNFLLKVDGDNKSLFKLYKLDSNRDKQGNPIKELQLHSPDQLINRYPAYIGYHPQPNLVNVLTFKDDKTLGQLYTFNDEQLLAESDWQNLVTIANISSSTGVHTEEYECKVRPISTLVPSTPQLFVSQVMLTDGNVKRLTGYRHYFTNNLQNGTYTQKATIMPGDKKDLYGWYEAIRTYHVSSGNVTKTEHWFNANGKEMLISPKEKTDEQVSNTTRASSESNKGLLLDRSGKWVISHFSPYKLGDEMTAYYGFEAYENNRIGTDYANRPEKIWHLNNTKIIKGKFAFTGENFLQLNHSSFLEGILRPRDQESTYLTACWIRCSVPLTLNEPVPYLRAIISTSNGAEVIVLLAQTKHQIGDWFYLELHVDFQIVKQIYQSYVEYAVVHNSTNIMLPSIEDVQFQIIVRVEVPINQTVDLDHIRFSPLTHDFQASVYHPLTGRCTAVIQANGLVIRKIYNHLQQEISNTDEEGQLKQFFSSGKTGKLVPIPRGGVVNAEPNVLSFIPESGFHETFDLYALRNRWQLDNPDAWHIAPGQLWHKQLETHQIKPSKYLFDSTSAAIRCYFALQKSQSSLSFEWGGNVTFQFMRQSDGFTKLILSKNHLISPLPSAGELIMMLEKNYAWVWLDGVLLLEQELPTSKVTAEEFASWSSFRIQVQGYVLLEDVLVMNRPQITVEYYNRFGEKTQVIQLEDTKTSLVTETLYDELGREVITTKTSRVYRKAGQSILSYRQDFVANKYYSHPKSVWFTGTLQGEIDRLHPVDRGVAYTRTEFTPNPLNEPAVLGLPGPEFSITGPYATKLSQNSDIAFLDNLFPANQGYSQRVEHTPNGNRKVTIFDKNGNQVATYVRVQGYNHLLSTYEYDSENRLIKILPPLYHEKVHTATKLTVWQPGEDHLSTQEKQWQQALGTYFIYDENGRLLRKTTVDSGVTEYFYNTAGQVRFVVSLNSTRQPQKIVYLNYDTNGQLSSTGHFNKLLSIKNLQKFLEIQDLPNIRKFQQFHYADDHLNPLLRNRLKGCITYNQGEPIVDRLQFNAQQQIVMKSTITLSGQADIDQLIEFKRQYRNNKVHILTYPVNVDGKPLSIVHGYNKLGQLTALGTKDQQNHYASFSYHATGQLASEQYQQSNRHGFVRNYHYNSPGFLDQIKDPFLTEEITYTGKGYGQTGYNGMITQTAFNASWTANADGRWFQLHERDLDSNHSEICIRALKRMGYLTPYYKPVKLYVRDTETTLPLVCGGQTVRKIAELVAERQTPNYYGHRYAYGNHQELVKAKYFTDDTEFVLEPLQAHTLSKEIPNLTIQQSRHIWQLLVKADYINTDQQHADSITAIGTRGKSFFRSTDLHEDLLALNSNYILYIRAIEQLVISLISKQQTISLTDFKTIFLLWQGLDSTSSTLLKNQQKIAAQHIGQMLLDKGYLPTSSTNFSGILDNNFVTILREYVTFIPQIVRVLSMYFAHSLGENPFDVESYDIDANGNHRLFYTGFNRYQLSYRNATNKIQSIKSEANQTYPMLHDEQGNVVMALHKGIRSIQYHPVSQRTTAIRLMDGRMLRFYYDAQGERILKRVYNAEGRITNQIHYLRDEHGRVLVDRQTKYLPEATQEIVTAYLYGPRGLLGFFRNNTFYTVTTDHAGSVRLVVKEGRVVAAYDYLPYGQLMRSYGNDPQTHIIYRYTGQEWDEETGLYNYHARLYDPSIGRFYQPDPKAQYFSPYKYAGNSPISTVDPDGEFAFLLICLALAVVGAYLGGAAANNRWNPADWDFSDAGTYLGMGGGALAGGLLPVGFAASATAIGVGGTIGLGAGGAYIMGAGANQNWNPSQWKWDRPHTWSGLFQGFGSGSGIAGGIALAHNFANTGKALTTLSQALGVGRDATKMMFLSLSYTAGGGMAYGAGVITNNGNFAFWQWDWTDPATWSSLIDGFDVGMGWPQSFIEIGRGVGKLGRNSQKSFSLIDKPSKMYKIKTILKNPKHPLYKVTASVLLAYFMGSAANSELDITRWSLASFSTYEGILNGIFFGKDTSHLLKYARISKIKQKPNSLISTYKHIVKHWTEEFSRVLDNIQVIRTRTEYQHLMQQLFSSDKIRHDKLLQLRDASLMSEIEHFFKGGLERWQKGEIQPPEVLKHLISEEVESKVYRSTQAQKLIEWRTGEEVLLKKQRGIFSDRDVEFLNCRSISRRRKCVSDRLLNCVPSTSTAVATASKGQSDNYKAEIIEQFFYKTDPGISRGILDDGGFRNIEPKSKYNLKGSFDSNKPKGFAEHLSLMLRKTPTNLAPSKSEFFLNFILGSLYTIPTNLPLAIQHTYAKIETVDTFIPSGKNTHKTKILKILFKQNDQTIVVKTFIFKEHAIKTETEIEGKFYKENLVSVSKYSKSELDDISNKLGIKDNYKIEENVFYVTPDNSLSVKESSTTRNEYEYKTTSSGEFYKIEHIDIDFKQLDSLSSNDINKVKSGVKEVCGKLLEVYNLMKVSDKSGRSKAGFKKENKFGFKITSEAGFHGFFYGALSLNFKYRYSLDIYVERIAGRGYADLIFLSRKDNNRNKNWDAIPIIIEFKADETSASSAIDQVRGTGYLYNLSMRTIADQAIIAGINSKIDPTDVRGAIDIRTENIPQPKGLIDELMTNINDNTRTKEHIKSSIEEELSHLYYSISPLAIKKDNNYFSRLIFGQFLSTDNVHIHVYEATDAVTTFVFEKKDASGWVMLNIITNSKGMQKSNPDLDKLIKLPNFHINSLTKIDIKVNHLSNAGWSQDAKKRTDRITTKDKDEVYFFQNIEVADADPSIFGKTDFTKLRHVEVDNFFNRDNIQEELDKLSKPIANMVNSESDFQAIFHGIFLNKINNKSLKTIKVLPEANLSKAGRLDLLISQRVRMSSFAPMNEDILIMELKYAKNDAGKKLEEANEQIFKYINNKSITDSKTITPIAIVFNKGADTIIYELHHEDVISHTSDGSHDNQHTGNVEDRSQYQQKLNEVADYVATLSRIISDPALDIQTFEKISNDYVPELIALLDIDIDSTTLDIIDANLQTLKLDTTKQNNPNRIRADQQSEIDTIKKKLADAQTYIENLKQFNPLEQVPFKAENVDLDYLDVNDPYDMPPKKKYKMDDRSKRSLNYPKYENRSSKNASVDKRKNVIRMASSGATSRLQFWPINLMKTAISSMLPISWVSETAYRKEHLFSNQLPLSQLNLIKQKTPVENDKTASTLLEMGDRWFKQSDMNGLLNLGVLLVRKWTGYKPNAPEILSNDPGRDIQLDIQSTAIVDKFINLILEQAQYCGIRCYMSDILEDSELYFNIIRRVREKLALEEPHNIPQLLFQQFVQNNIGKLASKSSQVQANKFLARLTDYIPNLQEFFEYEEDRTMASGCCKNIKLANTDRVEELAQHCLPLTKSITTTNMNIFTNISTSTTDVIH